MAGIDTRTHTHTYTVYRAPGRRATPHNTAQSPLPIGRSVDNRLSAGGGVTLTTAFQAELGMTFCWLPLPSVQALASTSQVGLVDAADCTAGPGNE